MQWKFYLACMIITYIIVIQQLKNIKYSHMILSELVQGRVRY